MNFEDKEYVTGFLKDIETNPENKLRPIAYHRVFATIGGGVLPGLFLSQCWFWTRVTTDEEGWFYKSRAEWETETGLTRSQQETARRELVSRDLIEEQQLGGTQRHVHYRINSDALIDALNSLDHIRLAPASS